MTHIDPVFFAERSCNGIGQDAFFMSGQQETRIRKAQQICVACPVLAECAAFNRPLVADGRLTGCVVGGVYAPPRAVRKRVREDAAAQLAIVARLARRDVEKGAA
ncbi:WhiB family transcriptional regulator [Nocardia xishanensis]